MKGWFTFFFLSFFLFFLSSLLVGQGDGWIDLVGNIGVIGRGWVVVLLFYF
jgi:hypothetical protein